MPEKMKELHVTVSLNNFHTLGGKDQSAYFVTIEGIGRFKHLLSYRTKQEAEALVTEMARSVAGIYMAEAKSRAGKSPISMGGFGKKPCKSRKR
jgi:hypothetical protein